MKPQPLDTEPLNAWSDRQFGDWIRASFYDYFINGRGRFAFEPLHTFFGEDYDVTEEMMDVFALLTEQTKTRFRSGLSIALAETELVAEPVIDAILNLARRTRATHILRVFANKMLRDWLHRKANTPELDHAIVWTVGVLATFAGDSSLTDESAACLETLARFEQMPRAYISPLFKLLCEARPTDLVANLKTFWELLNDNFGEAKEGRLANEQEVNRKRLVKEVLEICGRDAVLPTITMLIRQSDDQSVYSYNWWQETSVKLLLKSKIELPGDEREATQQEATISTHGEPEIESLGSPAFAPANDWRTHWRKNFPAAVKELEPVQ